MLLSSWTWAWFNRFLNMLGIVGKATVTEVKVLGVAGGPPSTGCDFRICRRTCPTMPPAMLVGVGREEGNILYGDSLIRY